jgi:CheY-like chemotaxis protein
MKILIIDDDADYIYLMKKSLEKKGQEVVYANSSHEGLSMAIEELPDLILLDLFLPRENGFKVLRELGSMESTKHIPVFILTNFEEDGLQDLSRVVGAQKYLKKNIGFEKISQLCVQ